MGIELPCHVLDFERVVAALFQELGSTAHAMPSSPCTAFRAFVTAWNMDIYTAMPPASAFVTVVTTLFQEMDTHDMPHAAFWGVAIVIPRNGPPCHVLNFQRTPRADCCVTICILTESD